MPGTHQVVGRGLARRIRRVRLIRRLFREITVRAERTVHLVGGDVMDAEGVFLRAREGVPIFARRLQYRVGADDVGLDELRGAVNGAFVLCLGGLVFLCVRLLLFVLV